MINIVERPSTTGKLIHLSPRDWKSYQGIDNALYEEEHGQYDTPDKYPIGTVAEVRATGRAYHFYIMKQHNGCWRRLTEPFDYFPADLHAEARSYTRFTLTILYNPNRDKSQSCRVADTTMNIIHVPNTKVGERMSLHPEWFRHNSYMDLCHYTFNEVSPCIDFKEYNGTLHDLPVGTTIQFQRPCLPIVKHYVKRSSDTWTEVTGKCTTTERELMSYPYSTATIIYMP